VRQGRVEVFYQLDGQGREGLYQALVTATTSTGGGLIGYRMLSVWLGLLTLSLVYVLGKRLFGALAGLAAMGLMAVGMAPIMLSRTVTPEAMLPLFVSAVLAALTLSLPVRGVLPELPPKSAAFGALGIILGLGFYMHPISIVVALFSMVYIVLLIFSRRSLTRRMMSYTWFAVVIMIVIATPYVISSLQHPQLAAAGRLLVEDPTKAFSQSLLAGFNGLFFVGDSNPAINVPGRPLIDLVSGLLVIVGLVVCIRYWRQSRCALLLLAFIFIAPFALHAPNSPNFLAFAPLMPLIALLFGVGVEVVFQSLTRAPRLIAGVGLVALLVFNVVWTVRDLFGTWANLPEVQMAYNATLGQLAHYVDLTAATTPTVICTSNLRPQINPVTLTNTQKLALMMHREDALLRYADCGSALILANGGDLEQIILTDQDGLAGVNPFLRSWIDQGEIVNAPDLPPDSIIRLRVTEALANRVGSFTTTAPASFPPESSVHGELIFPPVQFGGNVTFLGYEQSWAASYAPGDVVPVITYWRIDGAIPTDLRLFTHILADQTFPAAQSDPISVLPAQLLPRDIFIQVTYVMLPRQMPRDTYTISIGAYEDRTQARLPVLKDNQRQGDRLFLGRISVEER
jgi:4-amino-4-deoxy-L-arabinose transferase-like glycosyltransferase